MDLVEIVRRRMGELGLDAAEVERQANLGRHMLADLLSGKKTSLSARAVPPLARALGLSVAELYGAETHLEEPALVDWQGGPDAGAMLELLAPKAGAPRGLVLMADLPAPGLRTGDVLVVDTAAETAEGELAAASVPIEGATRRHVLRRRFGSLLVPLDGRNLSPLVHGTGSAVTILGPLRAVWRQERG